MQHPPGLWPTYRHDHRQSGFQPLPGAIDSPAILWKKYLGGPVFDAHVVDVAGERLMLVPFGGCLQAYGPDGTLRWRTVPCGLEGVIGIEDIDCDGRLEIVASNGRSVLVFSASEGALLFDSYVGPPFGGGFLFTCALLHHFPSVGPGFQLAIGLLSSREVIVLDFSHGAAQPHRRHILWMDDFFHPTLLAADVDGDGHDELVVTKLSSVYVFDPASGNLKSECRWSSGGTPKRNYGLFQIRDISGDGHLDMLILSYVVSRHIAVVGIDDRGQLHNRWDRFIEHVYPHDECELRYAMGSCCDVDSDGRLEIVVSVYNEAKDDAWWLEIIDGRDGSIRSRIRDLYLHDVVDVGDGRPLILASRETERVPDESSSLHVLTWNGEAFVEEWCGEGYGFHGRYARSTPVSTVFKEDLPPSDMVWIADGSIVLRMEGDRLGLLRNRDGEWGVVVLPGSDGATALVAFDDIDGDGSSEYVISKGTGEVVIVRDDGSIVASISVGMRYRYGSTLYFTPRPASAPVVFDRHYGRYLAVPDAGWQTHLFEWDPVHGNPIELWHRPMRGVLGPEEMYHSLSTFDCDGETMLLASTVGGGQGELIAVNVEGEVTRCWVIPQLPGSPRVGRGRTGLHQYVAVDTLGGPLIFVSGFRSGSMNSEVSLCLDVATGEALWSRTAINDESEEGRGFGPWNGVTIAGTSAAPRVVFLAKDTFCEIDLRTGEPLRRPWQLRPFNTAHLRRRGMSIDDFSAYGTPVPVIVSPESEPVWILSGNYGGMGAIGADHSARWWLSAPLPSLTSSFAGIADIDDDGIVELGLSYADGDFVCLRGDTGEEKWRLHNCGVASDVVACDIDGDGRIEFVLATREGELMAIGSSTSGAGLIKWRMQFPTSLGPPVVADFDGDGESEVIVVAGDGWMYAIGNKG